MYIKHLHNIIIYHIYHLTSSYLHLPNSRNSMFLPAFLGFLTAVGWSHGPAANLAMDMPCHTVNYGLVQGNIYRKSLYLMVITMVSCKLSIIIFKKKVTRKEVDTLWAFHIADIATERGPLIC